jgi:hypothetical protein
VETGFPPLVTAAYLYPIELLLSSSSASFNKELGDGRPLHTHGKDADLGDILRVIVSGLCG